MKNITLLILLAITAFALTSCVDDLFDPEVGVKYEVTMIGNFTAGNFPTDYPSNDHFSAPIGIVHNENINLFSVGTEASIGIEVMAETGKVDSLSEEILEMIDTGNGYDYLLGKSLNDGNDTKDFTLYADETHSLVSVVSMIAPSPDWFVAINDYDLYQNGNWIQTIIVPATAWDAGTDSGTTYTAEDEDTQPRGTIEEITDLPLGDGNGVNVPVAYFKFERKR